MSKENTNVNINPFAVGFLIITIVVGYYFIFALPNQSKAGENQQAELDSCLEKAEEKYRTTFELNSYPAPQEGYPYARRWNDARIIERIEDNLRKNKEICIQLYK